MPESSLRVSIDWRRVSVTCKLAGAQCGTHLCHAISISSRAQVTRISAGAGDLIHFSLTFYCHRSDSYQNIVTHDQRCKKHEWTNSYIKSAGASRLPEACSALNPATASPNSMRLVIDSSILLKLILFSIALAAAPLTSYYLSRDYVWGGMYIISLAGLC